MSSFFGMGFPVTTSGAIVTPTSRGPMTPINGIVYGLARLPTDPIGTHTLTLTNVVSGSHIWIGAQNGSTTFWNEEWGSEDYTYNQASLTYDEAGLNYDSQYDSAIVLPVYAAGSPLNDWRIRIRKATEAPYYQPYETLMTATVGSSSIYVSQIPD